MSPIKVLYIYGDALRFGGIEMFMMNYFRNMDSDVVRIDFLLQGEEKSVLEEEILQAGSKVIHLPKPGQNMAEFKAGLRRVLCSGEYKIIHAHCDAMNYRIMKIAKQCGVPVRIAHSHNTEHVLNSRLRYLFYEFCRRRVGKYATHCWACSDAAGKWLFGRKPYTVVPNAIDLERFRFNPRKRTEMRAHWKVDENTVVLGNVGRFDTQKNQGFLVELLKLLDAAEPGKYALLFVGDGWMRQEVEERLRKYHLEDKTLFAGEVSNAKDYYHMMDIYTMPSLFEGYGIAIEEAEANGLYCVVSDKVPQEVNVPGRISNLPLVPEKWCELIRSLPGDRTEGSLDALERKGYNIASSARKIQAEYVRLYGEAANCHV